MGSILKLVILCIAVHNSSSVKFNMNCECGQREVSEREQRDCETSAELEDKQDRDPQLLTIAFSKKDNSYTG